MTDDKTKVGAADRRQISVNQDYELRYWSGTLGCDADTLRLAVSEVGPWVYKVREYLKDMESQAQEGESQ